MPRKKIEKMDITCLSCNQTIKDASMLENAFNKCPHCGFEFVMDEKTQKESMTKLMVEINKLMKRKV
jgi:predicted RNA-binding Zn-ribbon protein involved in translation (DUF1610 family)